VIPEKTPERGPLIVRLTFKSVCVAAMAAGCLALAACSASPDSEGSGTASGPGNGNASGQAGRPVTGGTVTVIKGNRIVCVMKVVNGTGQCQVPAKKLGTGTSSLFGLYKGSGYGTSRSQPVPVTVTKGK
jgi:hypothetical protein